MKFIREVCTFINDTGDSLGLIRGRFLWAYLWRKLERVFRMYS